jgi:hypothetical protein
MFFLSLASLLPKLHQHHLPILNIRPLYPLPRPTKARRVPWQKKMRPYRKLPRRTSKRLQNEKKHLNVASSSCLFYLS